MGNLVYIENGFVFEVALDKLVQAVRYNEWLVVGYTKINR